MDETRITSTWYCVVEDPTHGGLPAICDQVTGRRVESVSAFVAALASRRLRRNTIETYAYAICGFLQFCSANPSEKERRGTALGQHLKRYIVGLALEQERDRARHDRPTPAPSRERTRLRTLFNTLVRYLEYRSTLEELAQSDEKIPSWHDVQHAFAEARARKEARSGIKPSSQSPHLGDTIVSEPELRSIASTVDERAGIAMMLFYYLGLDARQAARLRCDDLHVSRAVISAVVRSGQRSRNIEAFALPVSTTLLEKLIGRVCGSRGESEPIFVTGKRQENPVPMTSGDLRLLVAQQSSRTGRRVSIRQLQMWGAAEALRKGESMETVLNRLSRKSWRSELRRAVDVLNSPALFPRMGWSLEQNTDRKTVSG